MEKFCDVIIPIYNAYDATVNCIESVIKNTDLTKDRLILVNDCSPDKRISTHINEVKQNNPTLNITVIENEVNKGFVGTVNVGMKCSDNDVLLLNSDTIVGCDWLNRLKRCAYSQPKVASVTAMSNNATLVSVPKGLSFNEVPDDITIDEYNGILSECAYRDYPQLPTAHGFCMYIRREVLDLVGFFDEESFGRGYGEENDFSFRCGEYGYKNLMCDDVIVYHLEGQSFSGERNEVLDEHLKILGERYPKSYARIGEWCANFPIDYICKNIKCNLELRKKKNVLCLIHEWDDVVGGTTIHVQDIISALSDIYNFHVLYPAGNNYLLKSYFGDEMVATAIPFEHNSYCDYNRYNRDYGMMIDSIIRAFAIDVVHIHHMIGHYFDIVDVANKLGVKSVITLHDFYSVCPSINMLYCNEEYCVGLPEKDCNKCLIKTGRAYNNIIKQWQSDWYDFLKKFDMVLVPSEDTKERLLKVYDKIEITAIEHGVHNNKNDVKPHLTDKLRVAFIGVICHHKGGEMIKKLIYTSRNPEIEFHIFGKSEYPELQNNLSNYVFHGQYERSDLNRLLWENKINLICFTQIWPETYSYTVNEAVSAGIPILSLDMGAGAERVKRYNLGWVMPFESTSNQILEKLNEIKNDAGAYDSAVDSVRNYQFKTITQMGEEYKVIYDTKAPGRSVDCAALRDIFENERHFYRARTILHDTESQRVLNEILSSAKWRVVNKIKVPAFISKPVKAVVRKIKRLLKR